MAYKITFTRFYHEGMNGYGYFPDNQVTVTQYVFAASKEDAINHIISGYGEDTIIINVK